MVTTEATKVEIGTMMKKPLKDPFRLTKKQIIQMRISNKKMLTMEKVQRKVGLPQKPIRDTTRPLLTPVPRKLYREI
jgi:hypothetical protein